jgi:hypothetical protein
VASRAERNTFGSGGQVTYDSPDTSINVGNGVDLQSDGKVVSVGILD